MPSFIVSVWREDSYGVRVEADNREEAEEKALELFDESENPSRDFKHAHGDQSIVNVEEIHEPKP